MNYSYFLGSNSKNGFYSIYDSFPPKEEDFLHILKGGPGSGKSSFMRKIAQKAEETGYTVHYILCSGDPDSLDGIYIPQRNLAFVDGTSPHPREPKVYGTDSDYIHLGQFFRSTLSVSDKNYVNTYTSAYKARYSEAYHLLSAADSIRNAALPQMYGEAEKLSISKRIDGILSRRLPRHERSQAHISRRFLSCVSCRGDYRLNAELIKLCKLVYQFDNRFGGADTALKYAAQYGEKRGAEIILCPDPVSPEKLSAVIFPEQSVGFTDDSWELPKASHIHIDKVLSPLHCAEVRPQLREAEKIQKKITELAFKKLAEAKDFHDRLEAMYKPHIDFDALNEYTDKCIAEYLS